MPIFWKYEARLPDQFFLGSLDSVDVVVWFIASGERLIEWMLE